MYTTLIKENQRFKKSFTSSICNFKLEKEETIMSDLNQYKYNLYDVRVQSSKTVKVFQIYIQRLLG